MKFGVVVFPGSNCDYDSYRAVKDHLETPVRFVWHKDIDVRDLDAIILPGGFSYGDYLRAGAISRFSPVMSAVKRFADDGGLVLGICNGFQVLTESGLLPGTLIRNRDLRFICKDIYLITENNNTPFSRSLEPGEVIRLPVAHNQGNYYCSQEEYDRLREREAIVFRYCDAEGRIDDRYNPNGSIGSIAGIINERGNVMGMMPHPERYVDDLLSGSDGLKIFRSMLTSLRDKVAV